MIQVEKREIIISVAKSIDTVAEADNNHPSIEPCQDIEKGGLP